MFIRTVIPKYMHFVQGFYYKDSLLLLKCMSFPMLTLFVIFYRTADQGRV